MGGQGRCEPRIEVLGKLKKNFFFFGGGGGGSGRSGAWGRGWGCVRVVVVARWTKQTFPCSKFLSPRGQLSASTAFEGS